MGLAINDRWKPMGQRTPTRNPTNTIGTTPAGGTPMGGNQPGGFTQTGPGGLMGGAGYGQSPGTAPIPGVNPTGRTDYIDPTGNWTPYTPSSNGWGGTNWTPGQSTNLYDLQMQRMLTMLRELRGGMGGPVSMNREPGLRLADRETPSTMADRTAAETAAFARAKERLGGVASGATQALKDSSTASGRSLSGLEGADMRAITQGLQSSLGDVVREQTMDRLERADEIDDRNLMASLTQRGQDIGQYATEFGGNIQQRGQDFQGAMNDPMRQMIMQMVPGFMNAVNYLPRMY